MPSDYCVYATRNADEFYYVGRGKTPAVRRGRYTGSGVFYNEFRRLNPNGWTTEVLADDLTLEQAKTIEAELLTEELLEDPLNLNLCIGRGGWKMSPAANKRFAQHCVEYHEALALERAQEHAAAFSRQLDELDEATRNLWLEHFKTHDWFDGPRT